MCAKRNEQWNKVKELLSKAAGNGEMTLIQRWRNRHVRNKTMGRWSNTKRKISTQWQEKHANGNMATLWKEESPKEGTAQKRSVHACTLETSRWIKGSTTKRENTGSQLLTYKVKNEKIKYDSTIVHGPVQNKSKHVPMAVWEVLSNSC